MASDHAISDPLLPGAAPEDTATRSRVRLAGAVLFGAGAATLAGVLVSPDPDISGDSLRAMLADADEAMHAAKRTGRDRVMAAPRLLVAS